MNRQSPWMTFAFVTSLLVLLAASSLWPESMRPAGVKWPSRDWISAFLPQDQNLRVLPEQDSSEAELSLPSKGGTGLIEFPPGDSLGFAKFSRALKAAGYQVVRVLHYGDSQIEGDRISADLRETLQKRYGGTGPGLQGMDPFVPMASVDHRASGNWRRFACFGRPSDREPSSLYGLRGIAHRYEGSSASVELRARSYGYDRVRKAQKLTLFLGPFESPTEVKVYFEDSLAHIRYYSPGDPSTMEFMASKPMSRVRLEMNGESPLWYGAAWDGAKGVAVDNVSMRGADGLGFKRIERTHFSQSLIQAGPGLVILQFGGNAVPYFKSAGEVERYGRAFAAQIQFFRRTLPDADILVVGPSDMAHKVGTDWETYPYVSKVCDVLREAAHSQGAAFFDVFAFMGGAGSMADWTQRNPPLAGADRIHFTPNGARKVGTALAQALDQELQRHHGQ
jgi:lysophospholipase L1-like esterase